jgi:hypothetical protein
MASDLSFVGEVGNGCVIYRETTGCYVVGLQEGPNQHRKVPTLACAYATCQELGAKAPTDSICARS